MLLKDNIGMMLIVVWHTFFFLWANFGLFVNFTSELVVPNEVTEMVVGVESIGDSVVADVEGSVVMKYEHLFDLNLPKMSPSKI